MEARTNLTTAQNRKLYNTINLRESCARHEIVNRRDPTTRTVAQVKPGSQLHTYLCLQIQVLVVTNTKSTTHSVSGRFPTSQSNGVTGTVS